MKPLKPTLLTLLVSDCYVLFSVTLLASPFRSLSEMISTGLRGLWEKSLLLLNTEGLFTSIFIYFSVGTNMVNMSSEHPSAEPHQTVAGAVRRWDNGVVGRWRRPGHHLHLRCFSAAHTSVFHLNMSHSNKYMKMKPSRVKKVPDVVHWRHFWQI